MSIQFSNKIREVEAAMEALEAFVEKHRAELEERMDRIEYRKKPGPKPRRLQEKMNDE
jgi:hypothetical protein